jgi:hypothetical protein
MSRIVSFFRSTALWILLLPYAFTFIGASSNQLVLWANDDKFPVKINPAKLQVMTGGEASSNPDGTVTLSGGHVVVLPDGTVMMDPEHCVMTSKTHLNLLADNWDFHDTIESVGDLLLGLGDWLSNFAIFVWIAIVIERLHHAVRI